MGEQTERDQEVAYKTVLRDGSPNRAALIRDYREECVAEERRRVAAQLHAVVDGWRGDEDTSDLADRLERVEKALAALVAEPASIYDGG